jgi:hypothetical protein
MHTETKQAVLAEMPEAPYLNGAWIESWPQHSLSSDWGLLWFCSSLSGIFQNGCSVSNQWVFNFIGLFSLPNMKYFNYFTEHEVSEAV